MKDAKTVAAYICKRYEEKYGEPIDEMKLQKMMYFAQREALIQTNQPLFPEDFRGWKYGPVLKELRDPFQNGTILVSLPQEVDEEFLKIMDAIFEEYAEMPSFSLTRLTHGEISWKKSRKGFAPAENSDEPMVLDDIRMDAAKIRQRREMLKQRDLL